MQELQELEKEQKETQKQSDVIQQQQIFKNDFQQENKILNEKNAERQIQKQNNVLCGLISDDVSDNSSQDSFFIDIKENEQIINSDIYEKQGKIQEKDENVQMNESNIQLDESFDLFKIDGFSPVKTSQKQHIQDNLPSELNKSFHSSVTDHEKSIAQTLGI
ncbi:hypothetical protein PPERSA_02897 [Pseudocohnilembus persalinus]|uniref:Uncharacterized protein n=1 Tax=Pseudocohnilembus persalinus TaxID=266149 RepID=A0A0V0QMN2_PSEPJ|nr:hypothetical protein PPERSA_02897 [Pseudocohnilembus persalinus]|eukprot:KRX03518.1 hypothetical protein PPERSA_02897 [Pseudocohnilembus persalinus]